MDTNSLGLGARRRRRSRRGLAGGKGSGPRGMTCLRFKKGKGGKKVCAKYSRKTAVKRRKK